MVQVLGLVFCLVGAVALALGLFTHAEPLTTGFARSPAQYAHDAAFGVVGATMLSTGFLLQMLPYLGISHYTRHWVTAVFVVVDLAIVAVIAYVAYGLLYIAFHAVEARRVAADHPSTGYDVRRRRDGIRFWHQELVVGSEDSTEVTPAPPG